MDPSLVKDLGFPLAGCVVLCYAIKLLWGAYQEQIKSRDAEQAAEIARLTTALEKRP
jgi:hypothetical protein